MASDLVGCLRNVQHYGRAAMPLRELCAKAADEIERLRASTNDALVERVKHEIIQEICELPGDNDPDADDTLILSLTDLEVILDRALSSPSGEPAEIVGIDPLEGEGDGGPHEARLMSQRQPTPTDTAGGSKLADQVIKADEKSIRSRHAGRTSSGSGHVEFGSDFRRGENGTGVGESRIPPSSESEGAKEGLALAPSGLVEAIFREALERIAEEEDDAAECAFIARNAIKSAALTTAPTASADREQIERDIRIAIWNAAMSGGMGQDLSQAFINRAMEEPLMKRVIAALLPKIPEGWRPISEVEPDGREWLGFAPGCGFDVVRLHSDGHVYAGAFSADWVKFVQPLPNPPSVGEGADA